MLGEGVDSKIVKFQECLELWRELRSFTLGACEGLLDALKLLLVRLEVGCVVELLTKGHGELEEKTYQLRTS